MPFNLQDYEPVEERLARFWGKHPNGRIRTEIISSDEKTVVMLALVFRDAGDNLAAATGHAQETIGSTPVNRTSWVENCETSAIGRALANLGYAPKGVRASREEMEKATRRSGPASAGAHAQAGVEAGPKPDTTSYKPKTVTPAQRRRIMATASEAAIDDETRHRLTRMFTGVTSSKDVPRELVDRLVQNLKWYGAHPAEGEHQLQQWEERNLPTTAAQAIREGTPPSLRETGRADSPPGSDSPEPGGEHTLTAAELEAAGQTKFDNDAIPD